MGDETDFEPRISLTGHSQRKVEGVIQLRGEKSPQARRSRVRESTTSGLHCVHEDALMKVYSSCTKENKQGESK